MVLRGTKKMQQLSKNLMASDFRNESMSVIDNNDVMTLNIYVADKLKGEHPEYNLIRKVHFDDYAVTQECDQSLHFQHPPYLEQYALPNIDQNFYENPTLYP